MIRSSSLYPFALVLSTIVGLFAYPATAYPQCPDAKPITIHVNLGGVYAPAEGIMDDQLRVNGLVPLTEPYTTLGYSHRGGGGGELMHASLLSVTGPHAIVDWVVVELRHPNDPGKRIATQSALLKRNGEVMAANAQPLTFCVPAGRYKVAVRHRNHLGVITNRSVLLDGNPAVVDFTNADARYNTRGGVEALQPLNADSTSWALWPGDVSFDGRIQYVGEDNDRDPVLQAIGGSVPTEVVNNVYAQPDVNLDSRVQYVGNGNDRDPILVAIGGSVPTEVREDFIPDDSLRVRQTVHFFDSTEWVLNPAESDLDSNTVLVFDINVPLPTLEIGHTLVGNAHGGILRNVTAFSFQGQQLTVHTSPANLSDIYEAGTLSMDGTIGSLGAAQNLTTLSSQLFPSGWGITGGVYDFGVSLLPDWYWDMTFDSEGVPKERFSLKGTASFTGRLDVSGALTSGNLEAPQVHIGSVLLFSIPVQAFPPIAIPVDVDFHWEMKANGSVGIQACPINCLFDLTGSLRMGSYRDVEGSVFDCDFVTPAPSFTLLTDAPGSATFTVIISAGIKGALRVATEPVGPYFSVGVNHKLGYSFDNDQNAHTELGSTLKVKAGLKEQFGEGAGATTLQLDFPLWESPRFIHYKNPGRIELISGWDQTGSKNQELPEPIVVRALRTVKYPFGEFTFDSNENHLVRFDVHSGGGSTVPEEMMTLGDGRAQVNWTLGPGIPNSDVQELRISLKDGTGSHIEGSPLAVAAFTPLLKLEYVSGNNQQGLPNMDLPGGLEFRVVSDNGAATPIPNIAVHFEVVSGGGEMLTPEVVTDATGSGYGLCRLGGYTDGEQRFRASLLDGDGNHEEGSPIEFTATFRPLRILEVTSSNCVTDPGTACEPQRIQLVSDFGYDQFNFDVPIPGVPVHFEILGGGNVADTTVVSDSEGYVDLHWTLGTNCLEPQQVNAHIDVPSEIDVVPPVFEFNGFFGLVDLSYPAFSGNEQAGVLGQPLSYPLRVKVTDQNGDPVLGNKIGFVVTSGGGTVTQQATTDVNGIAEGSWTLGTEGPQEVMATNIDDCNYSITPPLTFTVQDPCPSTITDIDGNVYDVVDLGGKCWTQQNLRVTHYNNGVPLRDTLTLEEWGMEWNTDWFISGGFGHPPIAYYPNPEGLSAGHLYMGYQPGRLCPEGWRVPRASEWLALMGFRDYAGLDWRDPNGFNLSAVGAIYAEIGNWDPPSNGGAVNATFGQFWTSSRVDPDFITPRFISAIIDQLTLVNNSTGDYPSINGYPCRCIRGLDSNSVFEP